MGSRCYLYVVISLASDNVHNHSDELVTSALNFTNQQDDHVPKHRKADKHWQNRRTFRHQNVNKSQLSSHISRHPALVTVNVLSYVFSATLVPIFILNPLNELSFLLNVIWLTFFSLVFLGITLGFFIYGRRLINLMPRELQRKLRRITRITEIQSCLYLTCWIINVAIFFYYHSPWSYLVSVLLFRLDLLAIISLVFVVQLKAYLTCCSCGSEDSYSYEAVSDRTYTSPKYASLVDAFSQSDKEATL